MNNPTLKMLAYFIFFILAGCSQNATDTSLKRNTYMLPNPILLGTFKLENDTNTIRSLLDKFETNAPSIKLAENVRPVYISTDSDLDTAYITYDDGIAKWVIRIQFVRSPNEDSKSAKAFVTSIDTDGNPGDPGFIYDSGLRNAVYQKLLEIQKI